MHKQKGFSLIELLIVVAIILIIAAIAIPNLLRARMAANEASAVASMRTVNTAMITYSSTYPTVGFAASAGQSGRRDSLHSELNHSLLDRQRFGRVASRAATALQRHLASLRLHSRPTTRQRHLSPRTRLAFAASAPSKMLWFAFSPRVVPSPAKRLARAVLPLNQ